MAIQVPVFEPFGALAVKRGETYDTNSIPSGMDMVVLTKGVLQYGKALDVNGDDELVDGKIHYARTSVRGVKVTVINDTLAYLPAFPNIPFVWEEFTSMAFNSDSSYTFQDDGIVTYGKVSTA